MGTNESKAPDHEVIERESKIGEANNHGWNPWMDESITPDHEVIKHE